MITCLTFLTKRRTSFTTSSFAPAARHPTTPEEHKAVDEVLPITATSLPVLRNFRLCVQDVNSEEHVPANSRTTIRHLKRHESRTDRAEDSMPSPPSGSEAQWTRPFATRGNAFESPLVTFGPPEQRQQGESLRHSKKTEVAPASSTAGPGKGIRKAASEQEKTVASLGAKRSLRPRQNYTLPRSFKIEVPLAREGSDQDYRENEEQPDRSIKKPKRATSRDKKDIQPVHAAEAARDPPQKT
ncbi:hypothetical protein EV426DRAFT_706815 [Tirmania nivea]|nr:hypothetical protein EV426DRAFT_706815 [Tirmania nivea]